MFNTNKSTKLLKIIVIGTVGVGKTSLINRYVTKKFSNLYKTTVGADFITKDIFVDNQHVTLQIWDTAGQERYNSLGTAFYRKSNGCVLVFDLTSTDSYRSLEIKKDDFLIQACHDEPDDFPFVLVGTKLDIMEKYGRIMSERRIAEMNEQTYKYCNNFKYFEIGIKSTENDIDKIFVELASMCLAQRADMVHGDLNDDTESIKITTLSENYVPYCSC